MYRLFINRLLLCSASTVPPDECKPFTFTMVRAILGSASPAFPRNSIWIKIPIDLYPDASFETGTRQPLAASPWRYANASIVQCKHSAVQATCRMSPSTVLASAACDRGHEGGDDSSAISRLALASAVVASIAAFSAASFAAAAAAAAATTAASAISLPSAASAISLPLMWRHSCSVWC